MLRRVFVDQPLRVGRLSLDADASHYLRNVLRLPIGQRIELFNSFGETAEGRIDAFGERIEIEIEAVRQSPPPSTIVIAAAIPKGDRADWMIEKLSEIGVTRFVPLATERSVVLPKGQTKLERWQRIAAESARQSRRVGVMTIDSLTTIKTFLQDVPGAIFLSTAPDASPLSRLLLLNAKSPTPIAHLLIGPEGGWSEPELADFQARGLTGAKLTTTILRVETAAIAAAVLAATVLS